MADEDTVLQEAMEYLKEAGQRIRATQSLMHSQGMTGGENHRDLLARLSTALAMTEAAYLDARRQRDLKSSVAPASPWLTGPEYVTLSHRLEAAHAAVEAALIEARRRIRMNEERTGG